MTSDGATSARRPVTGREASDVHGFHLVAALQSPRGMKTLAIVMLVFGFLALGLFGLMQFRNIGEYEEQVERAEGPDEGFNRSSASPAEIKARKLEREAHLQESRDLLELQKSLRFAGGLGAPLLLIGGAVLLRRRRTS